MEKENTKTSKISFKCLVVLGKGLDPVELGFEMDGKDERDLVWDDVLDAAWDKASEVYSSEDFPNMDVGKIFVEGEGEYYPVVSESETQADGWTVPDCKRYLVLPEFQYSLSEDFRMFLTLRESGLLAEDADFERFREIYSENVPDAKRRDDETVDFE